MIKLIKELFHVLDKNQRKRFYALQTLVIISAIFELIGIASIGPFMALVSDIDQINNKYLYIAIRQLFSIQSNENFLIFIGLIVLLILAISTILSIITIWRLSIFSFSIGVEISNKLYDYYLSQNWLYHAEESSSKFIKQITTESDRVTAYIIQPIMLMNAKIVLAILISIGLLIYNPVVTAIGTITFISCYFLIYKIVKNRIHKYGNTISTKYQTRFKLMNEAFGGIKNIILLNKKSYFTNRFIDSGKQIARSQGLINAISQVPKYFIELIAYSTIISLILFMLIIQNNSINQALPILSIYALAGFKLLPALQQIYTSLTQIKGNTAAFYAIQPDLKRAKSNNIIKNNTDEIINIDNYHHLRLENVSFTYPNKDHAAINHINIKIPLNSTIGIVGESGSGKSTLIDLLLGLITPDKGNMLLDELKIYCDNMKSWQSNIGFVPQSIFLTEGTIAENIAFGVEEPNIDQDRLCESIKSADLLNLINKLPDGVNTHVGERGVQLSGGQRQRIGIARALYNNNKILIFDEATSALDGITEKTIMSSIKSLGKNRTIVLIAHRLKTIKNCDIIYYIENGRIIDYGTYDELISKNDKFLEMSNNA